MDELKQLRVSLLLWLCLATPGLLVLGAKWRRWSDVRRLLPPLRTFAVPWSGSEVLLLFGMYMVFWPLLGTSFLDACLGKPDQGETPLRGALALGIVAPFRLASLLLVPRMVSGTQSYQLGLTKSRLGRNVLLGYLGWMVLHPLVYIVEFVTLVAYRYGTGETPAPHPLMELVQAQGDEPWVWCLLWFLTVLAAPILEELLFRGVLLFWLLKNPNGAHGTFSAVVALSFLGWQGSGDPGPFLFTLALLPALFLLPRLLQREMDLPAGKRPSSSEASPAEEPGSSDVAPAADERMVNGTRAIDATCSRRPPPTPVIMRRVNDARAIYATAALFAIVHPWPDCIPLFLLALGLGWLAFRTRSLVGPMVLHALFNGVACLQLWLSSVMGP